VEIYNSTICLTVVIAASVINFHFTCCHKLDKTKQTYMLVFNDDYIQRHIHRVWKKKSTVFPK